MGSALPSRVLHAGWGGCFLAGGHSQPFSSWGCPSFLDFARRLGGLLPHRRAFSAPLSVGLPCLLEFCTPAGALCFLSGGHSQLLSPWSCPALAGFARRLGRSASSPADILSPSPRGAWPFLRILHAGWRALLPLRRAFSAPLPVGLCPALPDFARRLEVSTSSPADILSPSPRGAALPS